MLVNDSNIDAVIEELVNWSFFGLDTETTGLSWKDRLFSIQLSTINENYYFDFSKSKRSIDKLDLIFGNPNNTYYGANIKFDMNMLSKEGILLEGNFVCISAKERVLKNNHFPSETMYSLNELAKRYLGEEKDNAVEAYIQKQGLFTKLKIDGKKKEITLKHFDRVPLEIMQPYAERDAKLALLIGLKQDVRQRELDTELENSAKFGSIVQVVDNEIRLTKVCQTMEEVGIKIDKAYCENAQRHEAEIIQRKAKEFETLTGLGFQDSKTVLMQAYARLGINYPLTAKGNPCFDKEALEAQENPVAQLIKDIRTSEKRVSTYYSSFLHYADDNGVLHANIVTHGAETGRMSYTEPALQTIPKEDTLGQDIYARKCFVPREDFCFVMIDYSGQEYRLLLDYAGEAGLIAAINNGLDVHQSIAELIGITRKQAKTLSFALLYGAGAAKLSAQLGVSLSEAEKMKKDYFKRLPKVAELIKHIPRVGMSRSYIRNWFGRVCYLSNREFAYTLPNHLIQSSGADICKVAMVRCSDFLKGKKSRLVLAIHDELVFEIHKDELSVVSELASIMGNVYVPRNGMGMEVNVEHSWKSWGYCDVEKGPPC